MQPPNCGQGRSRVEGRNPQEGESFGKVIQTVVPRVGTTVFFCSHFFANALAKRAMEGRNMFRSLVAVCVCGVFIGSAMATAIPVGTGGNCADISIQWSDGFVADFAVSFNGSISGMDAITAIQAGISGFSPDIQNYGYGDFVNGLAYNGHSDDGYGGGANWWHYWIKDAGQTTWTSPSFGASDRTLADGASDGWVYGSDAAPTPEPATMALLAMGGIALIRKK
jgi:hypothetical protein